MVIDSKTCSRCGAIKQTEEFHKNKSSPDGLYSICRECKNVKGKARRLSATVEQRQKESQRLRKSYLDNKDAKREARKLRYEANKNTVLKKNREWRERNLEKHRELCRSWARKNPDSMRSIVSKRRAIVIGAGGTYSADDVKTMLLEQSGLCAACSVNLSDTGYHVDHIYPLSKGGTNWPSNLQLLCPTCNRSKGSKLMSEWLPRELR